jgi:hypothetical protein
VHNITTTTAAIFLPTIWSLDVLRATETALVLAPLVKRLDSQVKAKGQAITVPNVSNLVANAKQPNQTTQTQAITETGTTIYINKWYEATFQLEDMPAIQAAYDLRSLYSEKCGYAIAKQIDSDTFSNYTTFTTSAQGQYGQNISDGTIVSGMNQLNINDIPMEGRAMVLAPSQIAAILQIDKFVRADYQGEYQKPQRAQIGPNNRYLWGNIYGFPVYYTNNVPVTISTPNQTNNILFQKEALVLAVQMAPRLMAAYWLPYLAWLVTCDSIYGVSGLRTLGGVLIKT